MNKESLLNKLNAFKPLNSVLDYTIPKLILNHPFKLLYYFLLKKIFYKRTLKGTIKTVETFFEQRMKIMLPASLDIYFFGLKSHPSEIALSKYLVKNLNAGDTFIDIGAHFGYFTKLASQLIGNKGKVIAIEASPETFKILHSNTNGQTNIISKNIAISDTKNGFIEFCVFPIYYSELNTLNPEQYENTDWFHKIPSKMVRVGTTTLSNLIEESNTIPKIIKIDVEGAEHMVIKGGIEKLNKLKETSIVIEFINENKTENYSNVEKELRMNNFQPYYIDLNGNPKLIDNSVLQFMTDEKLLSENIVFKKS